MELNAFKNLIISEFSEKVNFDLSEYQCECLFDYMNLLIEKNKVMNLTAITDPKEIILRHFVDSSILLKIYGKNFFNYKKIVDVGTGAGFPGLPLAILCSKGNFVLTDTLGKRINFLQEVIGQLKILNVKLIKARTEDFAHDNYFRESFDYCLSRGVAKISVLSEYSLPLLKIGGKMLAYKLNDCDEELNEGMVAINTLGGKFHVKHSYDLILGEPKRCILEIDKTLTTLKRYPRKAGIPSKEPL